MDINYDFGDLEAFLAVKETGSFHGAAERLNLSQSAITRRIRKLEQALDSQLFERTTRAVKPTLAAKRLQARAEAMLQDARETSQAMRDDSVAFAHQRSAILTLAVIPTLIRKLVIPAIDAFYDQGHTARIRLLDVTANEVSEAVANGEADLGISSIPLLEPNTEFDPLFEEKIVLALSHGSELARQDKVCWQDLQSLPMILPLRGTGNRTLIDEAFARQRVKVVWHYEVGRTSTAIQMVQDGLGAALIPEAAARSADLTIKQLPPPALSRSIGLLRRVNHPVSRHMAQFETLLRHMILKE